MKPGHPCLGLDQVATDGSICAKPAMKLQIPRTGLPVGFAVIPHTPHLYLFMHLCEETHLNTTL